jgi:MraZ protein
MLLFLSTYENKIDKKGRVSVPAPFRSELERSQFNSIIVFPHPDLDCIEVWDRERLSRYAEGMDDLAPMSAEYDFASTLMSKSRPLTFDGEGRVGLPEAMLEQVGIDSDLVFAGRGQTFQIWSPENIAKFDAEADARVAQSPNRIRLAPRRNGDGNG